MKKGRKKMLNEELNNDNKNVDIILKSFVMIYNKDKKQESIKITLNVQGIIISGEICSVQEYLMEMFDDEEVFISEEVEEPKHIHLKNAQIFVPGNPPLPSKDGVYWRGKLADVNGFYIGKLIAQ
jgi:hypothetical protein